MSSEFQSKIKAFTSTLTQLITSNTSSQNTDVIASTKAMINNLLLSEEVHWRQRSRMMWLATSDCNIKFFHKQAHQRWRTNTISGLMNIVNEWYTDEKQVEDIAVAYFEDLFHTTQPMDLRDTLLAVKNTVTQEANRTLLKSFTAEEV